jgi:hypothetical protein
MPSNIQDLIDLYNDALPAVATWNVVGYDFGWQVDQVRQGRRFVPSLPLPPVDPLNPGGWQHASSPDFIRRNLDSFADDLRWVGKQRLPICLRYDNLCRLFDPTWSPNRCAGDGIALANSPYVVRLRELIPSPAWVQLVDNNEGCTNHDPKQYRAFKFGFAETAFPASPVSLIGYGNPLKDADYRYDSTKVGLEGYAPEENCFNSMSPSAYATGGQRSDFTSLWPAEILNMIPQWELSEEHTVALKSREVSVSINSVAIEMTPERYAAYAAWLLWSIRAPGVPAVLRWFKSSIQKPGDYLRGEWVAEDYVHALTDAADEICTHPVLREFWLNGKPVVNGRGHPTDVYLHRFNRQPYPGIGQPDNRWRVLDCDANGHGRDWWHWKGEQTNRVIGDPMKVWAAATELDGHWLVCAWSPCKLTDKITLTIPDHGSFVVDTPQPLAYWLVKPVGLSAEKLEMM